MLTRRAFLLGSTAAVAVAVLPLPRGDGVALVASSHPIGAAVALDADFTTDNLIVSATERYGSWHDSRGIYGSTGA